MDGRDAGDQRGLESPLHFGGIWGPRASRVEPPALVRRPRQLLRGLVYTTGPGLLDERAEDLPH